jgi:hypothetical protein
MVAGLKLGHMLSSEITVFALGYIGGNIDLSFILLHGWRYDKLRISGSIFAIGA